MVIASMINELLLRACLNRDIPSSELLRMLRPVQNLQGEERIAFQNQIAKEIEAKYPYRPGREPNTETIAEEQAFSDNTPKETLR